MRKLVRTIVSVVIVTATLTVAAQGVGSLRGSSWDLPKTEADNTVVSEYFGALSAVQTTCPQTLQNSLAAERALAACARLGDYFDGEMARSMAELAFLSKGSWVSPWQEDPGFGVVRRLTYGGAEYYLAMNEATGLAYVIRFE